MVKDSQGETLVIGDLTLDVAAASLFQNGAPLPVSGLTFDLLVCLAKRAPALASRDFLMESLWPETHVGEETLKQRVRLLRRALGDDHRTPTYIRTIRGKGYQLIPEVRSYPVTPVARHGLPGKTGKFYRLPLLAAVAFLGILFTWWFLFPLPGKANGESHSVVGTISTTDLYRRAKLYYHRYHPVDNQRAIELLKQAISKRPDHGLSHALLSRCYSQQPKLGNGYWGDQARAAADRAIDLAPHLPDGYVAMGLYFDVSGFPQKGIAAYAQALNRQPDHADAMSNTACDLMDLGRLDEALVWNTRALELEPDGQFGKLQMAMTFRLLGYEEQARQWFEKTLSLQPDNFFALTAYSDFLALQGRWEQALALHPQPSSGFQSNRLRNSQGMVHFFKRDWVAAKACFLDSKGAGDPEGGFCLALVLKMMHDPGADLLLQKQTARLTKKAAMSSWCPQTQVSLAILAALNGALNQATLHLQTAFKDGFIDTTWLKRHPALDQIQEHPPFLALIEKMEAKRNDMRRRLSNGTVAVSPMVALEADFSFREPGKAQ